MAKVKIDFTGVEEFVKCQVGEHVVEVVEAKEAVSQGGNDMISIEFEVVSKGDSQGAKLYDNFALTEKALWKLKGFLTNVGLKAEGKVALDLEKLEGKKCIVKVEEEEYNGSLRARIKDYKKLEAKPQAPTKSADVEDEDDEWEEE